MPFRTPAPRRVVPADVLALLPPGVPHPDLYAGPLDRVRTPESRARAEQALQAAREHAQRGEQDVLGGLWG